MKAKERIIYDNTQLDTDSAREEFIERTGEEPTEEQIWDEYYRLLEFDWDNAKMELKKVFDNGTFLAVGTCGMWYGNFAGGFLFSSFDELMNKLTDCEYFKIWDENGHFFIEATHHDGTHSLEIKKVTKRGKEYFDNWEYNWDDKRSEREVHRKMFTDSHYANLINFAHNVYGCPKRQMEKED